jgi:hypothetical protein
MSLEPFLFAFGIDDDPQIQELVATLKSRADSPELDNVTAGLPSFVKKTSAYYGALGKFVTRFSQVETFLQQTLWSAARVDIPVAPAIFSGLKVEGCLQYLKRIADAKGWDLNQKSRLEEITNRLGQINKLRNDILHYGVLFDPTAEDGWLMSNKDFAHIPKKIRETSITPQLLGDASADLTKIFVMVILLTFHDRWPEVGARLEKSADEVLANAWRYKPPPPAKTADKS